MTTRTKSENVEEAIDAKDLKPGKLYRFSKTYAHSDLFDGVFTFYDNIKGHSFPAEDTFFMFLRLKNNGRQMDVLLGGLVLDTDTGTGTKGEKPFVQVTP